MSAYLTPAEVAERLRVTTRTVYNWLRAGTLPAKRFGGLWRIDERELEPFTQNGPDQPHNR